VADRLGVSFGESAQALASAQGPAMRMRTETLGGVTIINDAYNANPGSMRAALNSLSAVAADEPDRRSIAVLGGMLELGAEGDALHRETGALAASLGVTLVTVGPLGTLIAQGALDSGSDADQIFVYSTHDEAAKWLASETSSGDAVLIKGSRGARMETVLERWRQLTASSVAA
jgi:UDP-N-acetylmuramoyl-tripeptide--D-alanyl-D-alanine ligase